MVYCWNRINFNYYEKFRYFSKIEVNIKMRISKYFLHAFLLLLSLSNLEGESYTIENPDLRSFSIVEDNDLFNELFNLPNHDNQYTNGLRIEWSLYKIEDENITRQLSYYTSANMYTPRDKGRTDADYKDRPYAGVTLFGFVNKRIYLDHSISHDFSMGVIGPKARQGEIQAGVHEAITSPIPKGWENQIGDDLVLQYQYQYSWSIFSREWIRVNPYFNGEFGAISIRSGFGFRLEIGDLSTAYKRTLSPDSEISKFLGDNFQSQKEREKYIRDSFPKYRFFLKSEANLVLHNGTIQGGLFRKIGNSTEPYTTDIYRFVIDNEVGVEGAVGEGVTKLFDYGFNYFNLSNPLRFFPILENMSAKFSLNTRSSESRVHDWTLDNHLWGSLALNWKF
jgi:lipid A 3-O-deacylase